MDFHVGQTFGDYIITGLLSADGMGQVYKVQHPATNRIEAMKVLSAEHATETEIMRFEREMRTLARLNHPNIAALHNAVHSEKQLIFWMEFLDGGTLESALGAGLPFDTGIRYIKDVLGALRYAHQQGVVHRDVTPANIIVTTAGEVKLTDFGLSKSLADPLLTNCGEILGSLPYLAPERLKGVTKPDLRSDLYSVAAILYEHLTGQKPFGAGRRLAPVITDSEPDPQPPSQVAPGLSSHWDEIIRRGLARNPERRYQSAAEFLDAIAQFDETAVAELPMPQLRTMTIGVALFAGLVLSLFAAPSIKLLRPIAPVATPVKRLHIAPPDFATALSPPPITPRPAKRVSRSSHAKVETQAQAIEPPPSPAKAGVEAPPKAIEPPPPPADEVQAAVPPPPPAGDVQAPAAPKRTFWNKLFKKKKNADPNEKQ